MVLLEGHEPAPNPQEMETGQAGEFFQGGIKIKGFPSEPLPIAVGQGSCPIPLHIPSPSHLRGKHLPGETLGVFNSKSEVWIGRAVAGAALGATLC